MMKDLQDMSIPTYQDMLDAHDRIHPYVHRTPVLTSEFLNDLTGAKLFLPRFGVTFRVQVSPSRVSSCP